MIGAPTAAFTMYEVIKFARAKDTPSRGADFDKVIESDW
jgi:hypothetical protein